MTVKELFSSYDKSMLDDEVWFNTEFRSIRISDFIQDYGDCEIRDWNVGSIDVYLVGAAVEEI